MRTMVIICVLIVEWLLALLRDLPAGSPQWMVRYGPSVGLPSSPVGLSAHLLTTSWIGREASPLNVRMDSERQLNGAGSKARYNFEEQRRIWQPNFS